MREGEERQGASAGVGWAVWAAGAVPAMIILPMYLFPLPFPPGLGVYAGRRLMEILWAVGLLLVLLRPAVRAAAVRGWLGLSRQTRVAAAVLVAGSLLSALISSAPAYSLRDWSLITLLLVVALPLGAILSSRRAKVLETIALTLVLYAILVGMDPLATGFAHPRFQGQALAVVVPPVLFAGNLMLALMAAPALGLGILNGSRALMLTLVMVSGAAWLLWPDRRRRMVPAVAGLAVAILVVVIASSFGAASSLQEAVGRGTSSTGRIGMWLEASQRFLQVPLLGEGPGMLARSPGISGWAAHPHNSVLLIAAETGIVGLAAVAGLVVRGIRRLPALPVSRRPWALALISGGFHSLFSGTIVMPTSQTMLVLALALALPAAENDRGGNSGAGEAAGGGTGWVLTLLGALTLGVLLATLFLPPAELTARLPGPRFFLRGIIP